MYDSRSRAATSSVELVDAELEMALLRRFEPVLRFTRGEQFFPLDAERYVRRASLWYQRPGEEAVCLMDSDRLDLDTLGQIDLERADAVYFLKFTDPLDSAELAAYHAERRKRPDLHVPRFRRGTGRLARVGYASRFVDALFNVALLARGRVPGDTAAAAARAYERMLVRRQEYQYHGRVVREGGWIVVQYWFFYVYNNWRTGFYGANDHEADWEMVCIYLAENDRGATGQSANGREDEDPLAAFRPEWVAYAAHDYVGDDLRRRWDDPELERVGTHPVVYVAAGSHACYFRSGEYLTELEMPFLQPLARIVDALEAVWQRTLRQYPGEAEALDEGRASNLFRIPFVDYARGDGAAIGPRQAIEWAPPRILRSDESWLSAYRGLWGLYARDPFAAENAPAGPMYNRDRSMRRAWYDPVGWAGLDKVAPSHEEMRMVAAQQADLRDHQDRLRIEIRAMAQEVMNIGAALRAMRDQAHLQKLQATYEERLVQQSDALAERRQELTQTEALLQSLGGYELQLRAGVREPARAHIRRALVPAAEERLRAGRLAEVWAAASIGLMLVVLVGLAYFARHFVVFGMATIVALFIFVEAALRGRLARMVTSVTVGLALVAALVLLVEFFWQVMALAVVLLGSYLLWDNLRELRD